MLPSAHPSSQPKQHIDRFSHFAPLMAECCRTCPGISFPLKIASSHGDLDISSRHFLGPTRVHNPNSISISSAALAQLTSECRQACPGMPFSPTCPSLSTLLLPMDISGHPSSTWFLEPTTQRYLDRFSHVWATVSKTVFPYTIRPLSVLSVTLVYCGQTFGRIKMKLGMWVGLDLGHTVLHGDPAPPPQRSTAPQFSARVRCGQTAGWIKMPLGTEVGLGPGDFVSDGDPALPSPKGVTALPIFGPRLLWPNGWHASGPQFRPHCARWGPSSPVPKRGQSPSTIFCPFLLWPNGWMYQDATWHGGRPPPRRLCV